MSLKENTIAIYKKFGLTDYQFKVYLVFLSYPQFTVSEAAGILDKAETSEDLKMIQDIADKLEAVNFIKKIPGVINRYVPCEPYLEMFNKESAEFRVEVTRIKDEVLADQSTRFENLEGIETTAKTAVDTTIQKQVSSIVSETESAETQKKETIATASTRFTDRSTKLMEDIQTATFTARDKFAETRSSFSDEIRTTTEGARDRFTETGQTVEKALENELFTAGNRFETTSQKLEQDLQDILEKGRDRYETTTQALENELHHHLDDENRSLKETVNNHDSEAVNLGEQHSERFTTKNNSLNSELSALTTSHVNHTQKLEITLHQTIDTLNGEIKTISNDFIKTYDEGIHREKGDINRIADDLLKDFSDRIVQLEKELKKSMDDYIEFHRETNEHLKPTLDEILEKNILRIKQVTDDLKKTFSSLLENHAEKALEVSQNLQDDLVRSVEDRHSQLAGQVLEFKENATNLMENLKDTSDRYEGLSEDLAKRGSAWKALLFGKHKKFQESYVEIKARIGDISGSMKDNFANSTDNYVQETGLTTTSLKTDIQDVTAKYHQTVKEQTSELDTKQQNSIEVQLEGLAQELTKETDDVMTTNFGKVNETTNILKDAVEHSFQTHHEEYDLHINKHRQTSLDFDDQRNNFTKMTVDDWYTSLDTKDAQAKEAISTEVADQVESSKDHLQKTTDKNTAHSADFAKDMTDLQTAQRKVYDELLRLADVDFTGCKKSVSEKLANQVKLFSDETTSMVKLEREQLDGQIHLVNTEFEGKNQFQIMRINEQIELFKKEVATINEKQQREINDHIQQFQEIVATLDSKQHTSIGDQVKLFSSETESMEKSLHTLLEKHKSDYKTNTTTMQQELVKTVETTIQDTKDAIADFTLTFMNSIDEVFEMADSNEAALTDISNAAMRIEPLGSSSTWHVFGRVSLLESIITSMGRTKSTITIITPTVEPKILEALSQMAYVKKSVRFLYTTSWDMSVYAAIVEKMKVLGNIQFRNLKTTNDFYAVSRDAEEIILCPQAKKKDDFIAIISEQEGYAALFMAFIYPIFQANSRPI